jgi:hypothetical protein
MGRESMKCLFADRAVSPDSGKKLAYQEILSYHVSHEKGCLKKGVFRVKESEDGSQLPILGR